MADDFENLWNSTAPKKVASTSSFDDMWNETSAPTEVVPSKPKTRTLFGQAVKGIDDIVGGIEKSRPLGMDLSGLTESARRAGEQRFSGKADWRTRQYAGMSGLLGLGDSLVNFPLVGAQQHIGIPQDQRVHVDMQGAFESLPYVQEAKNKAPDFYDSFAGTAQGLAPLPVRGAGLAEHLAGGLSPLARVAVRDALGTTVGKVADAAVTQGVIQGANLAGDVAKKTNNVDPMLFAAGAGLGGALGGALEGAVPAAKKLFGGIAKNAKASPMTLGKKQDALGRAASAGLLDNLEGEDAAIASQMLGERAQPKLTRVTSKSNPLPYPQYLDFGQAPKPEPNALPYPQYLDFGQAPKPTGYIPPTRFEQRGLSRSLEPIINYAKAKASVDGPMGQLAQAIIEEAQPKSVEPAVARAAGEFRSPVARDADGKILKGYLQSQKEPNVHLDPNSEAGMIFQSIADTKIRMQEREVHMDQLSKEWRRQAKVPLEAKNISLSGHVAELQAQLAAATTGKKPIISQLSKAKKELAQVQKQLSNLEADKSVRVGDIVFKPGSSRPELTSEARAQLIEPVREGLLSQSERELLVRGGPYTEQEAAQLARIKQDVMPAALHVDSGRPEDFVTPADLSLVHNQEHLKRLAQEQADDDELFKALKKAFAQAYKGHETGVPLHSLTAKTSASYKGTEVPVTMTMHKEAQMWHYLDSRQEEVDAAIKAALAKPENTRTRTKRASIALSPNIARNATGGILMASDAAAHADDGQQGREQRSHDAAAIGALIIASGHLPLIRKALKAGAGKAAFVYSDALDSAKYFDNLLGKAKGLDADMREHNALALMSQFGVHFDSQEQKAHALQLLREGAVTAGEARGGTGRAAQVFGALNQAQRDAVVEYYLLSKSIAKRVKQHVADAEQYVQNNAASGIVSSVEQKMHLNALRHLDQALSPTTRHIADPISTISNALTGNAMDAFFLLNPEHHLLNLTDSIIAGGSRTGPINMFRAWRDMALDRDIRKAFNDSNLFGSYRAEKNAMVQKANSGNTKQVEKEFDFKSDLFNANRTALSSWYQFFSANKPALAQLGVHSRKDFVLKLLDGKLDPTMTMDAWVHMGEANMRTMGVDPLRMNKNMWQRGAIAPLVSFVSQPLRMARLVTEYAKEGRMDRLTTLFVLTTALGGAASIPASIRAAGEQFAPQATFAYEKALNDMSIPGMLGNADPSLKPILPNMATKLDYDPINPIGMGSMNVGISNAAKLGDTASQFVTGVAKQDPGLIGSAAQKLAQNAAMVAVPKVRGIPTNMIVKGINAAIQTAQGSSPVYFFKGDKQIAPGVEVPLNKLPLGPAMPITDKILPGQPELTYEMQQNRKEKAAYKNLGIKVKDKDVMFQDPLKGLSVKSTKDAKAKREKEVSRAVKNLISGKI